MRQQLHYLFLNQYLPAEMLDANGPKSFLPANWILQLQDVEMRSPALQTSTAAFFAARVAQSNNDKNFAQQCRSMYVESLKQLQIAMACPRARLSDETLAACMALSLYELTGGEGATGSAYMAHMRGAMALLELRGPDASASPLGHSLFLDLRAHEVSNFSPFPGLWPHGVYLCRAFQINRCLIQRRETFLSRPEWLAQPWNALPKSPHDDLVNMLFHFPAIFRRFDAVSREKDQGVLRAGLCDVIAKFLEMESALQGLHENFKRSVSSPLYWPALSTLESRLDDEKSGKLFPVSFQFPSFSVALTVTTYWSNMMVLHNQLGHVYHKLETLTKTCEDGSLPALSSVQASYDEGGRKWEIMAKNICQSVEYLSQDHMGSLGPLAVLSFLSGCYSCFGNAAGDWSREMHWISDSMLQAKRRLQFPTGNFLTW